MENIFNALNIEEEISYKGLTFKVTDEPDYNCDAPWENSDGHGVIGEWTSRPKYPSERLLMQDWNKKLFYDVQESIKKARKEGWQPRHTDTEGMSQRQIAALAVEEDYDRLKDWCDNRWWYNIIRVSVRLNGEELGYASVGGIESDCGKEWIIEMANDLAEEAYREAVSCLKQRVAAYGDALKIID